MVWVPSKSSPDQQDYTVLDYIFVRCSCFSSRFMFSLIDDVTVRVIVQSESYGPLRFYT
jgi:hypothetical protein